MIKSSKKFIRPQDLPLKFKLMAVILFVAILISMVSVIGFRIVIAQSNEMIYTQTANSMSLLSDNIFNRLENIMEMSTLIAFNRNLQNDLRVVNEGGATMAYFDARTGILEVIHARIHRDIISISVLPANAAPVIWSFDPFFVDDSKNLPYALQLAAEAEGAAVWHPTGADDGSLFCVREIRSLTYPFLGHLGYVVVRVNFEIIVEEAAEAVLLIPDYQINIYKDDMLLYPSPDSDEARLPRSPNNIGNFAIQYVDGESWFIVYSPVIISRLYWDFVLGVPYGTMFRALTVANILYFASIIFAVFIAAGLSFLMFGWINRHIKLREELLLTQARLNALEQQINPHFLYNSLESVRWLAERGDGNSITAIVGALGNLLRNTLSVYEDLIPLEKELEILESYVRIQRIRFPDTLSVVIDAQPDTYSVFIPKMSIQPLVENAINYALEENIAGCNINVRAVLTPERIKIEVENDGSEIDEDILNLLREKRVKTHGSGVGLINIDTRIRLLFGEEYGLRFKNEYNCVTVSYELPILKEV